MNRQPTWVWIAAAAAAYVLLQGAGTPAPKPTGPDLLPAFRQTDNTEQAREDAVTLAALCDAVADAIEYDAARGEQARLTTGVQLDNLRRWSREYLLRGESLGTRYPQLPDQIGKYLDAEVGTAGGKLDADVRKKWITAHRQLADCAEWAAEQL